jgi:hypothetical protein
MAGSRLAAAHASAAALMLTLLFAASHITSAAGAIVRAEFQACAARGPPARRASTQRASLPFFAHAADAGAAAPLPPSLARSLLLSPAAADA